MLSSSLGAEIGRWYGLCFNIFHLHLQLACRSPLLLKSFSFTYAYYIENTYLLCDYFSFKAPYVSRKISKLLFMYRNALNKRSYMLDVLPFTNY
jgi:hypothetical protein